MVAVLYIISALAFLMAIIAFVSAKSDIQFIVGGVFMVLSVASVVGGNVLAKLTTMDDKLARIVEVQRTRE